MKYLKYYENIIDRPQIGDYIISNFKLESENDFYYPWNQYLNNSIGQIIEYNDNYNVEYFVNKEIYDRIFIEKSDIDSIVIKNGKKTIGVSTKLDEIEYFSPDIEELKPKLLSKKFNI